MTDPRRAAVWIDHHEARIFHVEAGSVDESWIQAPRRHVLRHEKGPAEERRHPDDARRFFHDVSVGLRDADQILVMGPGTAKLQLLRHLREHERELERRVVGVETVDHPSDRQIAAYVRRYYELGGVGAH
jgi:stalled ribosome rescue protein Dom34